MNFPRKATQADGISVRALVHAARINPTGLIGNVFYLFVGLPKQTILVMRYQSEGST